MYYILGNDFDEGNAMESNGGDICGGGNKDPDSISPCFIESSANKEPGPEAYDEFEAALNGTGLVIRVLKDTHHVESIQDGTEDKLENANSELECDSKRPGGVSLIKNYINLSIQFMNIFQKIFQKSQQQTNKMTVLQYFYDN